jgi:hypothetical protein
MGKIIILVSSAKNTRLYVVLMIEGRWYTYVKQKQRAKY